MSKILKLNNSGKIDPIELVIGRPGWTIWRGPATGDGLQGDEDIDLRSLGLSEVDLSKAALDTCLKGREPYITGEVKLRRLRASKKTISLGGDACVALWKGYEEDKPNSCLEWLRNNRGVTHLDLYGLVLRNPHGNRFVPCFYFSLDEWHVSHTSLRNYQRADRVSLGVES